MEFHSEFEMGKNTYIFNTTLILTLHHSTPESNTLGDSEINFCMTDVAFGLLICWAFII